jgi:D-alanyl-D-alanine carboxypeptidase (penicillin-binding protein 5/6)
MKRVGCFGLVLILLVLLLPLPAHAALEVPGKSALLMDVTTGTVLYEKNAHEPLPPASVTKVMTLLLIMEAIDDGRLQWEDLVTASETAAAKGGSQIFLKVGEQMTVADMVKSIAVSSANDCACAMAEHLWGSEGAFVEKMNARAAELGMQDTHFVNCTGLDDDPDAAQHKTSAYDIAVMSRQLLKYHPKITEYTTIWMDTVRGGSFGLSNTNKLVRFYNGATGLKTGFTQGAGYCLSASASRDGLDLIAVVMGCETSQERFSACKSMLDYGFSGFAVVTPRMEEPAAVPVKLGREDSVFLVAGEEQPILMEKGQRNLVTTQIELAPEATAPVSKGQKLGTMTIRAGDQVLAQVPLVAEKSVEKLSWGQMLLQVLRSICLG